MAPRLRAKGDLPPTYGDNLEEFTVELHHGGFFVGYGQLRSYVNGKISWVDNCEVETWSTLWLDDFVEQLGYTKTPLLKTYWLLPGKDISDGLRIIVGDSDTRTMCSVVDRVKRLIVYLDHQDSYACVDWDDIAVNPNLELPKVLSPAKVVHIEKKEGEKLPEFYTSLRQGTDHGKQSEMPDPINVRSSDDDSEDSDFQDSEYELEEGDHDVFMANVDQDEDEDAVRSGQSSCRRNKKAAGSKLKANRGGPSLEISSETENDDELLLPEEDIDAQVTRNMKAFNEDDLSNPVFKVGMVFDEMKTLRKAITEYSLKNRVNIKMPRNEKKRLTAHCADGCPWTLYASHDKRVNAILIKKWHGKHNCQKEWNLKMCTAPWLAEKYVDAFRADPKMSITRFGRTVLKDWNLDPPRSKLGRAKRLALKKIHGDEDAQYNLLWDYANEIRRTNPGSSFFLNLELSYFSTCYMSIDACKRGFMSACRPLICLDGCHLKTKYGGILLTAVGIDPNDCIYPIAIAVVEVESKASWKWFLNTLKQDLGIINTYPWTLMTDKQKGLIPAIQEVFPESEHRFCVRHLWANFRDAGFKGEMMKKQLWACARSSTEVKWKYHMDKMRALDEHAYHWLDKMPPNTWVRAFFAEFPKCDLLLNNNCEVFNSYILEAREMPILSMFEKIQQQLMTRYYTKQKEVENFVGNICPKIRKKVAKNADLANMCYALPSGRGVFQVSEREFQYVVNINTRECECRKWNLTGIPCQHAIACLRNERIPFESMVHDCYSVATFHRAYELRIHPCSDKTTWQQVNGPQVLPPKYEKKVGRPQRNRRKHAYEVEGENGPKLSRHGVIITCSYCKEENHNAKGCYLKKMGIRPEDYAQNSEPIQAEEPRNPFHFEEPSSQFFTQDAPSSSSQFGTQDATNPATTTIVDLTQDVGTPTYSQLMSSMSSTMLLHMMQQTPQSAGSTMNQLPLPDSAFIISNVPVPRPASLTTATKKGRAAATKRKTDGAAKKGQVKKDVQLKD